MKDKLKFKKLLNEFRSLEAEFEYNSEVLREANDVFECTYLKWCEDNGVSLDTLQEEKSKKVIIKQPTHIDQPEDHSRVEVKDKPKKHKDVFKSIAKKIHPDKVGEEDPRHEEFTTAFQRAAAAMNDGQWGELFDVIDRYKIEIPNYDEANVSLEKDVGRMSEKLQKQKTTYAWHLQNCEGNEGCIDMVVSAFLKQVFEWDGTKST
tara:strand:+ start:977 stop:1594 length:618 start_codon:yes stop_codon:yes gene_type:complete